MKSKVQKITLGGAALCLIAAATAQSLATIAYISGPGFAFQSVENDPPGASLDLNQDGIVDFNFQSGYFLCTADVPSSACSVPFYVIGSDTNSLLGRFSQATILPFGAPIGLPGTNTNWVPPDRSGEQGATVTVADYFLSPRYGTRGYGGPLVNPGVGYLAVRFSAADGPHYGWIRVLLPGPDFGPDVVDWAYETQPNTPIAAGLIASTSQSRQFLVAFQRPEGTQAGTGSLILTDGQLRCELTLAGAFVSADLDRSGPARSQSRPIASLGLPVVSRTNYTAFFRDIPVSRGDVIQLLRGALEINIDGGSVVGRISELK